MNKHDFYFGIYLMCTLLCIVIDGMPNAEFSFVSMFLPIFGLLTLYHFIVKWVIWFTPSKENNSKKGE